MINKNILLLICAFGTMLLQAQNSSIDSLLLLDKSEEAMRLIEAENYTSQYLKKLNKAQVFSYQEKVDSSFQTLFSIDTTLLDKNMKSRYYSYLAKTYEYNNEVDFAYEFYTKERAYYLKKGLDQKANKLLLDQFQLLVSQEDYITKAYAYLDTFGANALANNWEEQIADYYMELGIDHSYGGNRDSINYYFNRAENIFSKKSDSLALYRLYMTKGVFAAEIYKNRDSSLYFIDKAYGYNKSTEGLYYTLVNKANIYRQDKEFTTSISLLEEAKDSLPARFQKKNLKFIYQLLAKDYDSIGNTKKSLENLKLHLAYIDTLNREKQYVNLIKYQTTEKEKQILIEQGQKVKNRNIAIALGGSLLLLSIIAVLIYRSTKRKQRIAEQEKELEVQKTTTLLKEQEITTINAMIEGQEKERLRLAGDLHDNLGGTLAAVKMHIGNLQNNLEKSKNPQELLDKANTLISEAYKNVRSIAHERNSGVMAKEGLLPAVQKLAKKVAISGGLHIDVNDFGLEERLSNHLEITIFRIIQELITNVIKHAQASEVTISLTQHEDELNIVVEDNGKGFKVGKLEDKDGMGLGSIERRVEHLEGTMLVDSTISKGTNVIIDIPI